MAEVEDFEIIAKAGFTPTITVAAQTAVSSLYFLKSLSAKIGVPLEQITVHHIVEELANADLQIRQHQQQFGAGGVKKASDHGGDGHE